MARRVDDDVVISQVIHALEVAVAADRPGDRGCLDLQDRFDLVEQFDGVADVAVELVDKADDGGVAQPADVHQRDGARLNAFTTVEDHQCRVHSSQGAVGVFREVFVAGGVEQVDHMLAVGELHHRGGDGDAALLFHFHPVGGRVTVGFARLHGTGHGNGLAHQQQLLGDGGLARVGVGNDGEGAALRDFGGLRGHGGPGMKTCRKKPAIIKQSHRAGLADQCRRGAVGQGVCMPFRLLSRSRPITARSPGEVSPGQAGCMDARHVDADRHHCVG